MQYRFVSRENNERLIVLFAGWAMDANPFMSLRRPGYDILVVWDYRDLYIDWSMTAPYTEICVFAWSLGVYAASVATHGINSKVTRRLAINGTLYPVDRRLGIPEAIFKGTLDGLDERNLEKFYRRLCGSRAAFAAFSAVRPGRDIQELREELEAFCPLPLLAHSPDTRWDVAVIGREDAIFPPANQERAWQGTPVVFVDAPHIVDFQAVIDRWTVDKHLTGARFSAGMCTYESEASVQDSVVESMRCIMEKYDIPALMCRRGSRTLEIGSGTGKLSRILDHYAGRFGHVEMWDLVDSAPVEGCLRSFRSGDAELMIMGQSPASIDFIASASTVQWFNSPSRFLAECRRVLSPGAYLLVGTYQRGNLSELYEHIGGGLPLLAAEEWRHIVPEGLECVCMDSSEKTLEFDSPHDIFRHLKRTGVNSLGAMSPGALREVIRGWHPDLDGKYRITYRPLVFLLRKSVARRN